MFFATSLAIVIVYGQNVISDPDMQTKVMAFAPFAMLFHFLLFIFFRRKISRTPDITEGDDDVPHIPTGDKGKKDLSYFR